MSGRRFTSTDRITNGSSLGRLAELRRSLSLQPMGEQQGSDADDLRVHALQFADVLVGNCPPSRELSLAITALEESVMWAVKAIVMHPDAYERAEEPPAPVDPPWAAGVTGPPWSELKSTNEEKTA